MKLRIAAGTTCILPVLAFLAACGPQHGKEYEETGDVLIRNQTGVECEGVALHWGGREITCGVVPDNSFKVSVDASIPDSPQAELWFTESNAQRMHRLPCNMSGLDRAAISKSRRTINVVFTLTQTKVVVGDKAFDSIQMHDGQ